MSPGDRYSRVVFTSAGGETLWNLPAIKSMCNVDNSRVCKEKLICVENDKVIFLPVHSLLTLVTHAMTVLTWVSLPGTTCPRPAHTLVDPRIQAPLCGPVFDTRRLLQRRALSFLLPRPLLLHGSDFVSSWMVSLLSYLQCFLLRPLLASQLRSERLTSLATSGSRGQM